MNTVRMFAAKDPFYHGTFDLNAFRSAGRIKDGAALLFAAANAPGVCVNEVYLKGESMQTGLKAFSVYSGTFSGDTRAGRTEKISRMFAEMDVTDWQMECTYKGKAGVGLAGSADSGEIRVSYPMSMGKRFGDEIIRLLQHMERESGRLKGFDPLIQPG